MVFSTEKMAFSNFTILSAASLSASLVLLANDVVFNKLHTYLSSSMENLSNRFSSRLTIVIEEFEGLTPNHMFEAANVYLSTKISPSTTRIKVNKPEKDEEFSVSVDKNQELIDSYKGFKLKWSLQITTVNKSDRDGNSRVELRYFELSFHKKYREIVLKDYLQIVLKKAKDVKDEMKAVRLHTVDYNGKDYWNSVVLNHPASFDTMAMDPEMKREVIEDLERFISRRDYYRRVGKAWKRGYLFYGPPGTGKSSLVAAMANYLKFDVYDLDLREVQCNSDLRRLLIGTGNRSILVIEDIDCNVGLLNREAESGTTEDDKITLSGLLNFIDGLWSSCGDERIIVFTTNHKDRLDPALLRPGRMDIHMEMSYCTFSGFKILAWNYLKIEGHALFDKIEKLLSEAQATPAEIAGELMKSEEADVALENLVKFLFDKISGSVEIKKSQILIHLSSSIQKPH